MMRKRLFLLFLLSVAPSLEGRFFSDADLIGYHPILSVRKPRVWWHSALFKKEANPDGDFYDAPHVKNSFLCEGGQMTMQKVISFKEHCYSEYRASDLVNSLYTEEFPLAERSLAGLDKSIPLYLTPQHICYVPRTLIRTHPNLGTFRKSEEALINKARFKETVAEYAGEEHWGLFAEGAILFLEYIIEGSLPDAFDDRRCLIPISAIASYFGHGAEAFWERWHRFVASYSGQTGNVERVLNGLSIVGANGCSEAASFVKKDDDASESAAGAGAGGPVRERRSEQKNPDTYNYLTNTYQQVLRSWGYCLGILSVSTGDGETPRGGIEFADTSYFLERNVLCNGVKTAASSESFRTRGVASYWGVLHQKGLSDIALTGDIESPEESENRANLQQAYAGLKEEITAEVKENPLAAGPLALLQCPILLNFYTELYRDGMRRMLNFLVWSDALNTAGYNEYMFMNTKLPHYYQSGGDSFFVSEGETKRELSVWPALEAQPDEWWELVKTAAFNGDALCQVVMGYACLHRTQGDLVKRYEDAECWYRSAVMQGSILGATQLALLVLPPVDSRFKPDSDEFREENRKNLQKAGEKDIARMLAPLFAQVMRTGTGGCYGLDTVLSSYATAEDFPDEEDILFGKMRRRMAYRFTLEGAINAERNLSGLSYEGRDYLFSAAPFSDLHYLIGAALYHMVIHHKSGEVTWFYTNHIESAYWQTVAASAGMKIALMEISNPLGEGFFDGFFYKHAWNVCGIMSGGLLKTDSLETYYQEPEYYSDEYDSDGW